MKTTGIPKRTHRDETAVIGAGGTTYYKRGQSPDPEFKLTLIAILAARKDAGIDPREIDGFSSYNNDRNDPTRLASGPMASPVSSCIFGSEDTL